MPSENPTPLHFILTQSTEPSATCSSHRKNNLCQWQYLGNKTYIHILRRCSAKMFAFSNMGFLLSQLPFCFNCEHLYCVLFSFLISSYCQMCENCSSQFHRHFPYWLSDQMQLKQFSPSLVSTLVLPWKFKLSFSIFHQYSILHTPKSTWRGLLSYPFLFLEMPKQLCILRPTQCS